MSRHYRPCSKDGNDTAMVVRYMVKKILSYFEYELNFCKVIMNLAKNKSLISKSLTVIMNGYLDVNIMAAK